MLWADLEICPVVIFIYTQNICVDGKIGKLRFSEGNLPYVPCCNTITVIILWCQHVKYGCYCRGV